LKRKVVVTKTAENKLEKLFDYLVKKWSLKVKNEFIERLNDSIAVLEKQPEIFPESKKIKGLRKCVITKQTTLFYRFNSTRIYIVTVFDTRQHPKKLKKDL